ncbi:MAG: PE-PGRS family protein, partial [Rhizobiaceae bacterium]|nr:PE-PGRS family protein [Rhizobiaceae bacterium]
MPIPTISDTIQLTDPTAGNANAGNGGDGYGNGNISYNPVAYVSDSLSVDGAHSNIHNGDHLSQAADWDAGGGGAGGLAHANGMLADITNNGSGGAGGAATSNGSLGSMSGGDTAAVAAATTGTQYTEFVADQHGTI